MSLHHTVLAIALFFTSVIWATAQATLPLMPWPQRVELPSQGGKLMLTPGLSLQITGDQLDGAEARWRERIARQTGWMLLPNGGLASPVIQVRIARAVDPQPLPESDESYRLQVSDAGVIVQAATRFGAMRGMETLLQLIQNGRDGVFIPFVTIDDWPRFSWRGLLIDSARHFMPVETLKRQIDGIAAARMNVFHWHLTDDQGWRFASDRYPQLQQRASDGLFYTRQQMKEIVAYASERGVRVVPELDLPGHASAIAVALPQFITAPGPYQMERGWGVFKPLLDPSREEVWQFIDTLVEEAAEIFPDPWLHIGGDEVDPQQWNDARHIQQFMRQHNLADAAALQAWFNQRLEKILEKHQRRMVGWDEIGHPDLPKSILIQSWRGQDALGEVAKNNYRGILSTGFYLDQPQSTAYYYRNEIWPSGLGTEASIRAGEKAQSWRFTMPRLKGSPVEGSFTLIEGSKGWRGFIDFAGRSRRMVQEVDWLAADRVTFHLDSWMGEVKPVVKLSGDRLQGYFLVGNVRYPVEGEKLSAVPAGLGPVIPAQQQLQQNLLGGEAALWGENVNASLVDTKLWPRAFAVAERLWSAQNVTDEENMYQRLAAVDRWSAVSVGLQQYAQRQTAMMRLANRRDILPLQILAQALEPAHYYTRQHLKFQAGHYNLFEPLNRLADVLPAESLPIRSLTQQVGRLVSAHKNRVAAQTIRQQLELWQHNVPQVLPLIDANYQLRALRPVALQVEALSAMGVALVDAIGAERTFNAREITQMQEQLDAAARTQDELVIALVRPLEALLRHVQ